MRLFIAGIICIPCFCSESTLKELSERHKGKSVIQIAHHGSVELYIAVMKADLETDKAAKLKVLNRAARMLSESIGYYKASDANVKFDKNKALVAEILNERKRFRDAITKLDPDYPKKELDAIERITLVHTFFVLKPEPKSAEYQLREANKIFPD